MSNISRRDFLRISAVTAAGALLAACGSSYYSRSRRASTTCGGSTNCDSTSGKTDGHHRGTNRETTGCAPQSHD